MHSREWETSPRRVQQTNRGIDCKLPLYHMNYDLFWTYAGLVDEEVVALECSKRETSSVKDMRK